MSRYFGGDERRRPIVRAPKHIQAYYYTIVNGQLTSAGEFLIEFWLVGYRSGKVPGDAKIARGMEHLERIEREYLPLIYARNAREMLRVGEVRSTFWIAKAHLTCALERKESRSPYVSVFYKRDHPDRDDENWRKHSVLRNEDGRMVYGTKGVKKL